MLTYIVSQLKSIVLNRHSDTVMVAGLTALGSFPSFGVFVLYNIR